MIPNILKILTFIFVIQPLSSISQEHWNEHFDVPGKGVWADENGNLKSDFSGISKWQLNFEKVSLSDENDYAKTVSTSGGRFECRDVNGEVVWISERIDISVYERVEVKLKAAETGSGANEQNKYLKAFLKLDEGEAFLFEKNGSNAGNWGSVNVSHNRISGQFLQIMVYMNNHYANDKVILDEVIVTGFSAPVPVAKNDLLINEILFNPVEGGADFVEIYNHSKKAIPISQLYLASRDKNFGITQVYPFSTKRRFIQPGDYLVLTKDTNGVFPWFYIHCEQCFQQMEKFPSFNNDDDFVVLLNEKMEIIDEVYYTAKMHSPVLYSVEGVSLERVSFEKPANSPGNWHSASSESGYGTPGYKNSQAKSGNEMNSEILFSSDSFSPNHDGYKDDFIIEYTLDQPGWVANVKVFDQKGSFVFQLVKNELLGTKGDIVWNGKDETGQLFSSGVYVVLVELFDYNGHAKSFKKGVVLTNVWE